MLLTSPGRISFWSRARRGCLLAFGLAFVTAGALADDKAAAISGDAAAEAAARSFAVPEAEGSGQRTTVKNGEVSYPLVVVKGTPYEMGRQLGTLMRAEIQQFVPPTVAGLSQKMEIGTEVFSEVWARSAAFGDDRVEQELAGLADGSGVPLATLQAFHAIPLLMPYSCSSIAAWGDATEDGHLYQTRNLDWSLEVGAHNFPVIVVYQPDKGIPHVVPTFAGMIGAHTGMNLRGIALAEMGDASRKEAPYNVHAPHFTVFFRTMLYDGDSLSRAVEIFREQPPTKRYHYVFGDGRQELGAVKVLAHSPEGPGKWLKIWKDNDPSDEFAPNVLKCVVYNDEGRGAFPTLQGDHGKLNGEKLVELANRIPIKGGNVENVVYDATGLRMWVSYAKGNEEAYLRPYVHVDLTTLDVDGDGEPELAETGRLVR